MDSIFRKTKNVFVVVWTAKHEPRRYGRNGELLIDCKETEKRRRRTSSSERHGSVLQHGERPDAQDVEHAGPTKELHAEHEWTGLHVESTRES